jgi:hypothetical protein
MRALSQAVFLARLLRKRLFSQGFLQHSRRACDAGVLPERSVRAHLRVGNVAILVAKSALSACSASATARVRAAGTDAGITAISAHP